MDFRRTELLCRTLETFKIAVGILIPPHGQQIVLGNSTAQVFSVAKNCGNTKLFELLFGQMNRLLLDKFQVFVRVNYLH